MRVLPFLGCELEFLLCSVTTHSGNGALGAITQVLWKGLSWESAVIAASHLSLKYLLLFLSSC